MTSDIDGLRSSKKNVLTLFLSCFYVDQFGRLDIAWDKYIPFATLYSPLTTVYNASKEPVQFKMDEIRVFMLFSVIVGLLDNSIRSSVDERGYLVINHIDLGSSSSVPNHIRENYGFFKFANVATEEWLEMGFKINERSPVRIMCSHIFPSLMYEMTAMSDTITKLIMKIGVLNFD